MRRLLLIAVSCLLCACASVRPPVAEGRIALQPGQGAALIAVTMTTLGGEASAEAAIDIVGPGGRKTLLAHESTGYIRAPDNEADGKGRLFLVPLLPGEYRIVRAWGSWLEDIADWPVRRYASMPRADRFTIEEGRVRYLGQIQVNLNFQPDAAVTDTRRRDLHHAALLWGVTDTSNIDFSPITGAAQ